MCGLTAKPELEGPGDTGTTATEDLQEDGVKDTLADDLQSTGPQKSAASTPKAPGDHAIKAYRTLRKDEDAVE